MLKIPTNQKIERHHGTVPSPPSLYSGHLPIRPFLKCGGIIPDTKVLTLRLGIGQLLGTTLGTLRKIYVFPFRMEWIMMILIWEILGSPQIFDVLSLAQPLLNAV